jgi:putative addiction module component (TIGR02574 family)
MTKADITQEALKLPVEERLELAHSLWASIEADADTPPLHGWQRKTLVERLAEARAYPAGGIPWEEVKARIQDKLPSRA